MGMPLKNTEEEETDHTVDDLLEAARYGDFDDVKLIVTRVPQNSQNDQGCTALHMASANGHLSVVRYLIENGADVNICNAENNAPLHWAALNGQLQVVEALISSGANASTLNRYDRTPVDEALTRGHQAIVDAITSHTAAATLNETSLADD